MKKLKVVLVLLICFSFWPEFNACAEESNNSEEVKVEDKFNVSTGNDVNSGNDINGSSILAGNNVTSTNQVKGIDMLFGNNVNHKGNSDYALLAGNNVNVFGKVNNDGVIFGNLVTFDASAVVERDMFIFANSVTLNGTIHRDVTIYAASVIVNDAEIKGNVKIYATTIEVNDNTVVVGDLSYNEDAEATISNTASIGNITLLEQMIKELSLEQRIWNLITGYCGVLFIFVAIALFVPALFKRIQDKNEKPSAISILSLLGYGALGLIAIPLVFIVLCYLVLGVPLAFLLLILYILVIWLSSLFTGYLYGHLIWQNFIKKEPNILLIGLIGITLNVILTAIPVVGNLFTVISLMLGVGIVLQLFKKN